MSTHNLHSSSLHKHSFQVKSHITFVRPQEAQVTSNVPNSREWTLNGKPASRFSFFTRKNQYRTFKCTKLDVNGKEKRCRAALHVNDISTYLGISTDQTKILLKDKRYRNLDNLLEFRENLNQVTAVLQNYEDIHEEKIQRVAGNVFPMIVQMNKKTKHLKKGKAVEIHLSFDEQKHSFVISKDKDGVVSKFMLTDADPIAKGGMKKIYLCQDLLLGTYAIFGKQKGKFKDSKEMLKEFKIIKDLEAQGVPHIVKAHFISVPRKDDIGIMMPYYNGGKLTDYLPKHINHDDLPEELVPKIVSQMITAFQAIHAAGYTHRDIKPDNFLLEVEKDRKGKIIDVNLKVGDFGISHLLTDQKQLDEFKGVYKYLAPECCDEHAFRDGRKIDSWAIGITLLELLHGEEMVPYLFGEDHGVWSSEVKDIIANRIKEKLTPDDGEINPYDELIIHLLDPHLETRWTLDQAEEYMQEQGLVVMD